MGSAQLDSGAAEGLEAQGTERVAPGGGPMELKQEVAERLRSHRERRGQAGAERVSPARPSGEPRRSIAAAVAERFAHSPSYRAVLAEEAQRAIDEAAREAQKAAAEAEVAARSAQAIAQTQQKLLDELELWNAPQTFTAATRGTLKPSPIAVEATRPGKPKTPPPVREVSAEGLTVRLYEEVVRTPRTLPPSAIPASTPHDAEEAHALDEEIAFRQAPVFEPFFIEPTTALPANLLEFPRQLIAARKARPRLAEGPLRHESAAPSPQLRIFEVEPEQISTVPAPISVTPEWATIRLDAHISTESVAELNASRPALLPSMLPPQTAPLRRRVFALGLDGVFLSAGLAAFAAAADHAAGALPKGIAALGAAAGTLACFFLLYELLFFTLSEQTPGMRLARIGLCTFTDENPSRSAIRRRIPAQLIAVCPLGIGLLWALLDDDGLGWHDRISRMYQRAY